MTARHGEHDFDAMYAARTPPPWEIGQPQPALAALLDRRALEGPVLDVGCGTGELALRVARLGHRVVGIDSAQAAVAVAQTKAAEATAEGGPGLDVSFRVADVARLEDLGIRPGTVLDSGLLHCLDDRARRAYVSGLEAVCDAGALVCVLAMSTEAGMGWGYTVDALTGTFTGPTWSGTAVERTDIVAVVDGEQRRLPALLLTTRRA